MMRAVVGDDPAMWKTMPSVFTPGSKYFTTEGSERMLGKRRPDEAKRLQQAGYNGERVIIPVAADVPLVKAEGDVLAAALQGIGVNVDYQALDWGQQASRIASKTGWTIYLTWVAGAECANPAGHKMLDSAGTAGSAGWPDSPEVQAALGQWFDATTPAAETAAAVAANRAGKDYVPFVPAGFFLGYTAWRSDVTGIAKSPFPQFWGVSKG